MDCKRIMVLMVMGVLLGAGLLGCAPREPIHAFCVDFNWGPGGPNGFAKPGLWADADPAQHVAWYAGLGANVIQTFAVSCNGYAWYKGGAIPAQPGLQHDFLPEVVQLGHARHMRVMGYYCIGANTRWGLEHPALSYGTPSAYHLPFTDEYLDYLEAAIAEGLTKSGMDGFMVDWVWNPSDKVRNGPWLPAEKQLFEKLMGQAFPGEEKLTPEARLAYERKASDRCWQRIHATAKRVKPGCIIWLSCNKVRDPVIAGSRMLKEVDWMMDESGSPEAMQATAPMFGPQTRQLLCVVGWGDRHDARKICADAANSSFGIYGFSRPTVDSLPQPITNYLGASPESFTGNDRNIAVLARWFNGKALVGAAPAPASHGARPTEAGAVDMAKRAQELKSLHWGMFICWSMSTFSGKEWTPGVKDIAAFKATEVDTDQWARTAKEAGMGYILFLTKHHDGFCLWDTKTTARKVTNAPLKRDVLAELRKSCDKYGIKLALYFSEGEFKDNKDYHPGGYTPEMKKAQLKELLTQYGPIEYIWFDHAQTDGGLNHEETVKWCKQFQPGCFIGFNHGQKAGDIRLGEMGRPGPVAQKTGIGADHGAENYHGYLLAEFTYPILPGHKGGAQWFYSLPQHDHLCKPAEKLYQDYLGAVKYGNIFSIDVGPDSRGKLRDIDVQTLRQVGEMIKNPPAAAAAQGQSAKASSEWGKGYAAAEAIDGDESTRWGAAPGSRSAWLEVDLGKETEIGRAVVMEIEYPRTQKFAIEYQDGQTWKTLSTGMTIAGRRVYDFAPVKARKFRLNILAASEVPTIEEFQLLPPGGKLPASMIAQEQSEARAKWFHEAKYGLFINWGLYAVPAGEWQGQKIHGIGEWIMHNARIPVKEYEHLADGFNPVKFNAEEWAQLAVDAGMKYVVYDCKHHDGFAMYHSLVSKYNVTDATPWKRDPFKELQEACAKRGLKFCFYYSQATDWHEPNGANNTWDFAPNNQKEFDQYLRDKSMPQLKELLSNYGPIGLIWFDVPTLMTPERSGRIAALVRSLQPDTLINSRLGPGGFQDYQSRGDNEIPPHVVGGAWETPATLNDTWGYRKDDQNWKSPGEVCFKLVDIVSKGGNYLLNVGPDAQGVIPQPSQEILRTVGAWLKVNGAAVYGAGPTPFGQEYGATTEEKAEWGRKVTASAGRAWRCTTGPGKLYLHLFEWPKATFTVDGFRQVAAKAYFLADAGHKPLKFAAGDGKLIINLPEYAPDPLDSVICVELKD